MEILLPLQKCIATLSYNLLLLLKLFQHCITEKTVLKASLKKLQS